MPAAALAGPTGTGATAEGVEHLTTVPAPAAVSANFKTVDGTPYMFVSTLTGLVVYDISDPASPLPAGALPLPHFQNEDVSIGGDRLLISTDGTTGSALLVVDISDPTQPVLQRAIKMELLGEGHTATCIDAACRWVWVAGDQFSPGITVLDLDKAPEAGAVDANTGLGFVELLDFLDLYQGSASEVFVGDFTGYPEFAVVTHDVHVDSEGVAWVAGGGGTIGFDVSNYGEPGTDPLNPPVVARTGDAAANDGDAFDSPLITGAEPDPENAKDTVNDFIHHNVLRPDGGDVALITEEDLYNRRTTTSPGGCETQGSFQTWGIDKQKDGAMTNLDSWTTEFNEVLANEDQDPWNGDIVPTGGLCSSHYFDERDGLVAVAWYEQGLRLLDVSNPTKIEQVGYFIPPGDSAWSAYWSPAPGGEDIVYLLNNKRGVDVLRVNGGAGPVAASAGAVARGMQKQKNQKKFKAHGTFGWMCRIAI